MENTPEGQKPSREKPSTRGGHLVTSSERGSMGSAQHVDRDMVVTIVIHVARVPCCDSTHALCHCCYGFCEDRNGRKNAEGRFGSLQRVTAGTQVSRRAILLTRS